MKQLCEAGWDYTIWVIPSTQRMQNFLACFHYESEWMGRAQMVAIRREMIEKELWWIQPMQGYCIYPLLQFFCLQVCNLRLPYKYLAPLYHQNRSGPNSFLPFVTHNSAHRGCVPKRTHDSEIHYKFITRCARYEPVTAAQKSSHWSINSKNVNFACFQFQMSMNGSFTNGLQWNEIKLIAKSGIVERLLGLNVHQDGCPTCKIPRVPECSSLREIEAN